MGYHLLSTWRELHPGQTDIQQTGTTFAWLFLPSANIAVYHSALVYSFFGAEAAFKTGFGPMVKSLSKIIGLFQRKELYQIRNLGDLIPDWNDAIYRGDWRRAFDALQATNPLPEFTGQLCPALCLNQRSSRRSKGYCSN